MTVVDAAAPTADGRPSTAAVLRLVASLPGRRDDAVAVLNGLFGDTLAERGSRLATPMTIRAGDAVLPLDRHARPGALATVVADARPRLCILVHGLMSTESIWRFPDADDATYGTLLADDVSVLTVRYNTGRRISHNGRELAELVTRLVRAWPVRVREINLIGHSMGGLVVRSACHYARHVWPRGRHLPVGRPWTSKVRRVVLIGAPNTGAGLEALLNSASAALWSLPIPAGRLVGLGLDRRSAGIKDLRFGAIVDDDWLERDPDARRRPHPHRPLRVPRADHLVIAGTVTGDHQHPVARLLGDALVTTASASGHSTDGDMFPRATTRVVPGVAHVALAHDPDVFDAIATWW